MNVSITPLHVYSGYSLLRGPTGLDRLVERAAELSHGRLALTDVNNLCGAPAFYARARQAGLGPIIGAELRSGGRQLVALVADQAGYENLCRILTRIHCAGRQEAPGPPGVAQCTSPWRPAGVSPCHPPRQWRGFSLVRDLPAFGRGLHFIVEDAALAGSLLASGADRGRLWLGLDPPTQSSAQVRALAAASRHLDLPLAATGKAMFAWGDDYDVARLLAAIRTGTTCDAVDSAELVRARACLRPAGQLRRELADFPEAWANNERLAAECSAYRLLPRRAVFPSFPCPGGLRPAAYLRRLCLGGMKRRYGRKHPPAVARMDHELRLIERMGFSEYFLVVWDIVRYARRRRVPVAGRGSGASSIVAYLLGVTNVCPLALDIPFERFLNEGRRDFPDLDIDFCWRFRDDVIGYAYDRWGADHVAMVSAHGTFQSASALRETAKAFGLSDGQISRLDAADLGGGVMKKISRLAGRIVDLPRNLSVHPGGIVIGPKSIDRYAPIQPSAKGVTITQYDKHGVEAIGLVKLDLLGNRSLSTIRWACDLVQRRTGRRIDIERLPPADQPTLRTLRAGDTVGCNQLESPAMRHLLKALRPGGVRDVMQALALIRPGAAGIGMKEVFIRRHRGLAEAPAGHPKVDEILRATGGVMLYEDDVMLVAAALIGGPPAEGDRFRRAVQKCRDDGQRLRLSSQFLARCRSAGVAGEYAKGLWVQMAKFNAYSFCRAHAASYAMLAYAVAWLKTHYEVEFWTAALNNNQSMYHPRVYVEQAKRASVRFLLPDANESEAEFAPQARAIRAGLGCVGSLGPAGVEKVLEARRRGGHFAGLSDCLLRTNLGREEARALILCGAMDFTGRTRPALMIELDLLLAARATLPAPPGRLLPVQAHVPNCTRDYHPQRKYADERRILGFSVREHIMAVYRSRLAGMVDTDSRLLPHRLGRRVRIAGVLEAHRTTQTRNGRTMRFLTLDDEHGLFEVTVFPGTCRVPRRVAWPHRRGGHVRCRAVLHGDPNTCRHATRCLVCATAGLDKYGPYVVTGKVDRQYDAITVRADEVRLA